MSKETITKVDYSGVQLHPTLESYLTANHTTDEFKILGAEAWKGDLANSKYHVGLEFTDAGLSAYQKYGKAIEKALPRAKAEKLYGRLLDEDSLSVYFTEGLTRPEQLKLLQVEHAVRHSMEKIYRANKKLIDNNPGKILNDGPGK